MKTAHVCKAVPIHPGDHDHEVESASLFVEQDLEVALTLMPHANSDWRGRQRDFYRAEAERIMSVLDQLPQATRHALLILMLERTASFYQGQP